MNNCFLQENSGKKSFPQVLSVVFLGGNPLASTIRENPTLEFDTQKLPTTPDVTAPDGSDVRILLGLQGGGMAHFELQPGQTSKAVAHRTVEEIWFFLAGHGQMWRRQNDREEVVAVEPGVCLTIPLGTHFQSRALGAAPLSAIAVTMPPWPGGDEAYPVEGRWPATTSD